LNKSDCLTLVWQDCGFSVEFIVFAIFESQCLIESFDFFSPQPRQAENRQAVKKPLFSPDNQLSQSNIFVLSQAEFCGVWVSVKNI